MNDDADYQEMNIVCDGGATINHKRGRPESRCPNSALQAFVLVPLKEISSSSRGSLRNGGANGRQSIVITITSNWIVVALNGHFTLSLIWALFCMVSRT